MYWKDKIQRRLYVGDERNLANGMTQKRSLSATYVATQTAP